MKLVKSLLLGSAAGLVAVSGASAADLGVKKPTAVEYVKTCPTYGAGFFVVPGTTSCLKLIGRVRADYTSSGSATSQDTNWARTGDSNVFRARGYIGYDHRTATEYGLLRTYVRAFIGRDNVGTATTNLAGNRSRRDGATLEYAFIQFGGLTAGRVTPVFEHGWGFQFNSFVGYSDITYVNSLGYTASFGGGFSASIAIDAAQERRGTILAGLDNTSVISGTGYAGQAMPDIVGRLNYDQSWGSLYLAGAVHQLRAANPAVETVYGFAVSLGGKFNLPMLAKGSNLWVSATYADGANSYNNMTGFGAGNSTLVLPDAIISGTSLKKTTTWGFAGGIQAYVVPTVWVGVTGAYAQADPFGAANTVRAAMVAGTVGWTPTAGFLIGAEVGYKSVSFGNAWRAAPTVAPIAAGTDRDGFFGRLRFQRDF